MLLQLLALVKQKITEVSRVCLSKTYMNIRMLKENARAMLKVAKLTVRSVGPAPMFGMFVAF